MLIDTGKHYENVVSNEDYLRIIDRDISHEFSEEVRKIFNTIEIEKQLMHDEAISDAEWYERENEEMARDMDEANSMLQQLVYSIEKGEQSNKLNRKKIIEVMNEAIKLLNGWRENY